MGLSNLEEEVREDDEIQNNKLGLLSEDDDDDDEFVFSDQFHQQQEFERFSLSLANIGFLDKSLVEDVINDTQQQQQQQQQQKRVHETGPSSSSSSTRRPSKILAYEQGREESFLAVLDEVERIEKYQASKGLSDKKIHLWLVELSLDCLHLWSLSPTLLDLVSSRDYLLGVVEVSSHVEGQTVV
ncbi:hypothetical protein IV203_000218 [Nitzschia inconspicua]|uniref:Uncharacterized protein n=1 Tax=Nitzschia inconspicua TaxID=303405 RepID=A0A9K3L4V4_9STRA|nr:hypothetical protein IV203_000218 [Nitzschia inconspicua]